jgi:hypothetical protein
MVARVIISGATGFIGRALCRELHGDYDLIALSRDARKAAAVVGEYARAVEWDARTTSGWARHVEGAHAIIALAGENIASGRWTQARRDSILQSRTNGASALVDAVQGARKKPAVVVQGSATGYYGSRGDEVLDEDSGLGEGFLAEVCRKSEAIAARVEREGTRCVAIRTGLVLGREGGILAKLMTPFRFCVGGHVGSGRQWISWISLDDEVRAIRFLLENGQANGAFNLTGPNPVTMKQFARTLGRVLHRPVWTFVPGVAARLALGRMAEETLLASQRVVPSRLLEAGFEFRHPDLQDALGTIIQGENNGSG